MPTQQLTTQTLGGSLARSLGPIGLALALVLSTGCEPEGGGSQTLPSGLEYIEVERGSGDAPSDDSVVVMNWKATVQGSDTPIATMPPYEGGKPARARLNGSMQCWREGLPLMREGGKGKLICPPQISFGEEGAPPLIPPNATLVYDIELLEVIDLD